MRSRGSLARIVVHRLAGAAAHRGLLRAGTVTLPCALGRTGVTHMKREGDGATPAGTLRLVSLLYRADRGPRPATLLPAEAIRPGDGWCDDPASRAYNRPVRLPFAASHEDLWRADGLYDLVVVLDWNLARPQPGRGSAIFFHLAAADLAPTAGCIAIGKEAMRRLLPHLGPETVIEVL
jgi:L,D-peptidoglycan transpeptidase YkuD (ErfK/YbiS/YcfS/YnhG family)